MSKIMPKKIAKCRYCGKEFFTSNNSKVYCSPNCRKDKQRERESVRTKTVLCLRCGREFVTGYASTKATCDDCREKTREMRRKEKSEEKNRKVRANEKLMEAVRESGISYGRYMSGCRDDSEEYISITKTEGWENGWVSVSEEKPVPKASLKVNVHRLPKSPIPYKRDMKTEEHRKVKPIEKRDSYQILVSSDKKGVPYTAMDDAVIIEMRKAGETFTAIGLMIGRLPTSVMKRYEKLTGKPA